MPNTPEPTAFLPLPSSEFRILLALLDAPAHGYGIMQEVRRRSDGDVQLGPGTLYGAIRRMVERDFIVEHEEQDADVARDRRRRTYAITPFGRAVARAEAQRMLELLGIAGEHGLLHDTPAV